MDGPKPYKFIGFGDIYGPKPYRFIGFGDIYGPKVHNFIGFGWAVDRSRQTPTIDDLRHKKKPDITTTQSNF